MKAEDDDCEVVTLSAPDAATEPDRACTPVDRGAGNGDGRWTLSRDRAARRRRQARILAAVERDARRALQRRRASRVDLNAAAAAPLTTMPSVLAVEMAPP